MLDKIRLPVDKMLVEVIKTEEDRKSPGGIFIPKSRDEARIRGKIVLLGKKGKNQENTYKVGEIVVFAAYSQDNDVLIDGRAHRILDFDDPEMIIRE